MTAAHVTARPGWRVWLPAGIWMAVIAAGSLSPGVGVRTGPDALLHGGVYLLLAWLLKRAFASRRAATAIVAAAAAAWGYGLMIEGLQGLLPYRTAEARDLLANALGVGVGLMLPLHRSLNAGSRRA